MLGSPLQGLPPKLGLGLQLALFRSFGADLRTLFINRVGNSSSQPYPASGLAVVIPTFVLRNCYYSLMKPIQSFVSHYSTDYEYSIMLSLLLSLLHVVVVIYNSSVMKKKVYLQ